MTLNHLVQKLTEIKKYSNTSCEVEVIQIHTTRNKKKLQLITQNPLVIADDDRKHFKLFIIIWL